MDRPKDSPEDSIFEPEQPVLQVPVSGETEPPDGVHRSPRWGATTKLIVGLSMVAFGALLLFRFLNIVGPLLLAFILAYLIYPIAETLRKGLRTSWRVSASLVYLILLILVIGSIGAGGLAVIEQVNSLITFLQGAVNGLPTFITDLTSHPVQVGPFQMNFQLLDTNAVVQQVLGVVQPILTQAGASVVSVATGAATVVGWLFFILLVSYFILAESGGFPNQMIRLYLPGYDEDIRLLGRSLSRIWNAFLRGQVTIVLLTILVYNIILGGLGLRFFFGLALLAGLARFIPYVGPFVAWTTYGLVAFFQGVTIFGVPPLGYVAIVVGTAWVTDMIMDNFVVPRLMSSALRVHPAAVMVSALVAFNLLGVIGVVLAAPVLATLKLFLEYIVAKLLDQDPWAAIRLETSPNPMQISWSRPFLHVSTQKVFQRLVRRPAEQEGKPASKNQE